MKMIGMKIIRHCLGKASHPFLMNCFLMLCVLVSCSGDSEFNGVSISLNKKELYLEVGKSERLTASFDPFDAPNQAHKWSSSDTHIATVDETGNVTAVNKGSAIIMAKALDGGGTAKCNVTVVDRIVLPNQIELNETNVNIAVGDTFALVVTIKPDNATDKTYSLRSLDESIASINDDGIITANSIGNTTIEIMTGSGDLKAICEVSVKERGVMFEEPYVSNITDVSAEITGVVRVFGISLKELGICYSADEEFDIYDNKVPSIKNDIISCKIDSLTPEATYYLCSYAIDDNGNVTYSNKVSFTTKGVLKTNFKPVEVYEDKILLASDAPKGYNSVHVCYAANPNPKVTDYINKAVIYASTGKLTVRMEGLKTNTTYYIRSYHEESGSIIYHDDEVAISTLGENNISKSGTKINSPIMKYYMGNTYYVEYKYTFKTNLDGELHVELANDSKMYMTKESTLTSTNKVRSLYFSDEVTLIFQVGGGSKYYNGAYSECRFNDEFHDYDEKRNICITHLKTGIKYIYNIKMGNISFVVYNPYSGETYIREGKNK